MSTRKVTDADRDYFATPKLTPPYSLFDSAWVDWVVPLCLFIGTGIALILGVSHALAR